MSAMFDRCVRICATTELKSQVGWARPYRAHSES